MLRKEFADGSYAYKVKMTDMRVFLKECTEQGFYWSHGCIAEAFDPFKFYEGKKIEYVKPMQKVDDPNFVYVRCLDGILRFSFQRDWYMNPYYDYSPT